MTPPTSTSFHCDSCVLPKKDTGTMGERIILFLQIDDVLALGHMHPKIQNAIEEKILQNEDSNGKGKLEEELDVDPLKWRITECGFLDKTAVSSLMELIEKIEAVGKQVGIVITGAWRRDGTTEQVCKEMFADQPFGEYIAGRLAPKGMTRDIIESWRETHQTKEYLVIMEKDRAVGERIVAQFGDKVITVHQGFGTMGEVEGACRILEIN